MRETFFKHLNLKLFSTRRINISSSCKITEDEGDEFPRNVCENSYETVRNHNAQHHSRNPHRCNTQIIYQSVYLSDSDLNILYSCPHYYPFSSLTIANSFFRSPSHFMKTIIITGIYYLILSYFMETSVNHGY